MANERFTRMLLNMPDRYDPRIADKLRHFDSFSLTEIEFPTEFSPQEMGHLLRILNK